jgi:hypothetical protein
MGWGKESLEHSCLQLSDRKISFQTAVKEGNRYRIQREREEVE